MVLQGVVVVVVLVVVGQSSAETKQTALPLPKGESGAPVPGDAVTLACSAEML